MTDEHILCDVLLCPYGNLFVVKFFEQRSSNVQHFLRINIVFRECAQRNKLEVDQDASISDGRSLDHCISRRVGRICSIWQTFTNDPWYQCLTMDEERSFSFFAWAFDPHVVSPQSHIEVPFVYRKQSARTVGLRLGRLTDRESTRPVTPHAWSYVCDAMNQGLCQDQSWENLTQECKHSHRSTWCYFSQSWIHWRHKRRICLLHARDRIHTQFAIKWESSCKSMRDQRFLLWKPNKFSLQSISHRLEGSLGSELPCRIHRVLLSRPIQEIFSLQHVRTPHPPCTPRHANFKQNISEHINPPSHLYHRLAWILRKYMNHWYGYCSPECRYYFDYQSIQRDKDITCQRGWVWVECVYLSKESLGTTSRWGRKINVDIMIFSRHWFLYEWLVKKLSIDFDVIILFVHMWQCTPGSIWTKNTSNWQGIGEWESLPTFIGTSAYNAVAWLGDARFLENFMYPGAIHQFPLLVEVID